MDYRARNIELDEGVVRISGGTAPGAFPHLCPFQPKGATREFCIDATNNLQRNKLGCFGVTDRRNIGPCNSELRRCVACLVRSEGKLKRPVVDMKRGLCEVHCIEVAAPPLPKPTPTRSLYFAPILAEKKLLEQAKSESLVSENYTPAPAGLPVVSRGSSVPPVQTPGSVFSEVHMVKSRMSREEKIGILKNLVDQLREEKFTVSIPLMVERATKKNGPLEGKTTPGSLRVFLYTLEETEKTIIGL